MKFRKKPVVIDAIQWHGDHISLIAISNLGGAVSEHPNGRDLIVHSLEGDVRCGPNDWVILGVEGEVYSCKDSVFQKTYERALDAEQLG